MPGLALEKFLAVSSSQGESSSRVPADIDGQSVRMPMSQYELMTAAKDILSALVQLERECIQITHTSGEFPGPVYDVHKPRLKAIGSERDRLLVKIHDQLIDNPHPAARSAQKKLAAKYDMTRMRKRAKRYDRNNALETTELEIPKKPLHEPFPELDEILKMIFEVWERLNKYFDKACDEPSYPTILDDLCLEFPHAVRHLCTTMPWTIWPALIVLWGVCWMFKPSVFKPSVTEPMFSIRRCATPLSNLELDFDTSQLKPASLFDSQDSYLLDFDPNPSWFESDSLGYGYEPQSIDNSASHSSDMGDLGMETFDHIAVSDASLLQDSSPNHAQGSSQENTSSESYSSGEGESNGPSASETYDMTPSHLSSNEEEPSLICEQYSLAPIHPAKDPRPVMLLNEKLI
ncbi:unnamed protein product [Clonostachys rosea f. rosea IK726]|uniref:Uncharacterized protein n=1 Tax=Clonostachys rosea f. rosea IK726 TaxID=1349383 RepID=A0ACA9U4F7_BIOOC|nr:unnamed protein product [Clonostachys rosea f. rosea IK726]